MKIRIEEIGEKGLSLDRPIEAEWLNTLLGDKSAFSSKESGSLKVDLLLAEDVVHVRGDVEITFQTSCARCLKGINHGVKVALDLAMFPDEREAELAADGELDSDDMGVSFYRNKEIDIADIVRDEVFLQLPMTLVCRSSCAGLCDDCGVNLNEGACGCPQYVDSRWSPLNELKLN